MSIQSPILQLKKLVLVGRDKNYEVIFKNGINIIYGDSDTGKSSILNLIDYALGGSEIDLYQEIETHGKFVLLELKLKNEIYTIKRDIFSPQSYIEVYQSSLDEMDSVFPKEYSSSFSTEGPAGYFSNFLLTALNIPLINIKQSPSKDSSNLHRLSFRDIFKYCYLDQDDVGSKSILDAKNFPVAVKNKETFKFIHNVLDSQITEIENQISKLTNEKLSLEKEYETLNKFFRETQIDTKEKLISDKNIHELEIKELEEKLNQINIMMQSDTEFEGALRVEVHSEEVEINKLIQKRNVLLNQLEQYTKLKKEYEINYEKFKLSLDVKKSISKNFNRTSNCPLCNSLMELKFSEHRLENYDNETLKIELNSLRNKIKELQNLIELTRFEIETIDNESHEKNHNLDKNKKLLDFKVNEYISPYLSQRDLLFSMKNSIFEKIDRIKYLLKLRNQIEKIIESINQTNSNIKELKDELIELKANAPSVNGVLANISQNLSEFLNFIPIKNPYGIRISEKTFLPVVRDRDYIKLTSGGLRTLVSIGYLFALLKNSFYSNTQFPSLLMIDTIGKYIGKTSIEGEINQEETDITNNEEALDDPTKYKRIYEYLNSLSAEARLIGKEHQIIIVDNDFPEDLIVDYSAYIIKRFSSKNKHGYEKGFINNA